VLEISRSATAALTTDITAAQLGILDQVYGKENVADIPKMWAMYKEVADYYLDGVSPHKLIGLSDGADKQLKIPDDSE
jgi:hypothetical protein